jgi:hypothetical protein
VPAKRRGIFRLKSPWSNKLTDRFPVGPLLDVVDNYIEARFISRDVSPAEEVRRYLRQWTWKQYYAYPFAFHGLAGGIEIGRESIDLQEPGEMLAGQCWGSESTLILAGRWMSNRETLEHSVTSQGPRPSLDSLNLSIDWTQRPSRSTSWMPWSTVVGTSTAPTRMKTEHNDAMRKLGFRAVERATRHGP